MRVAIFVPSWPPGFAPNGIVTYASQIVPALRKLGHRVFVLTPHKSEDDDDPDTIDLKQFAPKRTVWRRTVHRLAPEYAAFAATSHMIVSAVSQLVAKYNVEVFEIEESFGWSFEIARLNLLPVVVRLHGPWFLNGRFNDPADADDKKLYRNKSERKGIERAQFVTAPSAEVLQAVKNEYGSSLIASRVVPNPLKAADAAETWSAATSRDDSLLYVGRFDSRKGGDLILRAFAELARSNTKLRLTFVGPNRGVKGPDGQVVKFDQYVRNYVPEEYRRRLEFRGAMKQMDVMDLRNRHCATVVASQYEIAPYSVLEAMSLGCPLVATAVGGIPELIKNQQNGLLVPSQDVRAMVAACLRLLEDRALAARLGRQAWLDCRDFYGPENIARQTVAAYQEAIDAFKAR